MISQLPMISQIYDIMGSIGYVEVDIIDIMSSNDFLGLLCVTRTFVSPC